MTALDDAKGGAAEQDQHGRRDAAAVRQIALDGCDQARLRRALKTRFGNWRNDTTTRCEPLAQQHGRANGGRFQVSLRPQRSLRSGEASCTIHCTSSSNVVPAKSALRVPAPITSRSCRAMRSSKRISATAHAPGSQAPHAPPALTFGLPGKQSVNQPQAGRILMRFVRHLPHINEILTTKPALRQGDLVLQEINEFDSFRL